MWGAGCGVWGVGCGVWGVGCGVWGVGCGVWGVGSVIFFGRGTSGFRVRSLWSGLSGLGFGVRFGVSVYRLGCKVWGLVFRVKGFGSIQSNATAVPPYSRNQVTYRSRATRGPSNAILFAFLEPCVHS